MIIRLHRFHGYNALRHVYSHGQTQRNGFLAIKYVNNPRRDSYRAAVVVSRKVHKSAVARNRIRRRLYEIIRGYETRMTGPYDIVVTVFSEQVGVMEAAPLGRLVEEQLVKAGVVAIDQATEGDAGGDIKGHAIVETMEMKSEINEQRKGQS